VAAHDTAIRADISKSVDATLSKANAATDAAIDTLSTEIAADIATAVADAKTFSTNAAAGVQAAAEVGR
jgi:hypothetical protein